MNNNSSANRLDALRSVALLPLSFLAMAGIGVVAVIGLVEPGGSNGILESTIALFIVANIFYFLHFGYLRVSTQILVALVGLFFSLSLYIETASRIGEFWLVLFPILALLLLGRRVALVFVGIFVLSMMPALFVTGDWSLNYSAGDLGGLIFGILLSAVAMSLYDVVLDKNSKDVVDEYEEEESGQSANLKSEIAQRQNAEAQMTEALRKLEENNQKLEEVTAIDEATISSIGEAVMIVDPDGSIVRANPSSGRVLGINQEDLIGNHIVNSLSFAKQDDENTELSEEQIVIHQSMTHRSINHETYKITQPEGTTLFAQMTASPLVVGGEVYGAVVVVRDVTQEVIVDQAKSEFVSIASHQLRTPLSTINWYLEMVLAGDFGAINAEQKEFIGEAYMAGKRMGDLINALLNASRLDVGVVAVEPTEGVDIRNVLKGVLTDLEAKLSAKKITANVQIDASVVPTNLDTRIMEIIFLNLLTNAVKYSPAGSNVSVEAATDETDIVIIVSDKGYGIPLNVQDKIFTKMFRADNAVEHEPDGNGLGLYIIKSILDTLGGSISFVSKEGEGTTFTIKIPKEGMGARGGAKQLSLNPELN